MKNYPNMENSTLVCSVDILKFASRISLRLQLSHKTAKPPVVLSKPSSLPRSFTRSWNKKRRAESTTTERMAARRTRWGVYGQELSRRQESGEEMG